MLRRVKELHGFTIHAKDGEIGKVEDVFFDDAQWTVRYIVVRTGSWLFGREVVLSPISADGVDWHAHEIKTHLTTEQVKESPSVEMKKPISRQQEFEFSHYFGYPVYWGGVGLWGDAAHPGALFIPVEEQKKRAEEVKEKYDHHLRSAEEVRGYRIDAADDELGRVEDFVFDDGTWAVRYMEVRADGLLNGKKVLISPLWIEDITWVETSVTVSMKKETISNAPEYDPSKPIDRDYEEKLFTYYNKPRYWTEE
jgi:sporulation protein YlmC with PRC-barrel domain